MGGNANGEATAVSALGAQPLVGAWRGEAPRIFLKLMDFRLIER